MCLGADPAFDAAGLNKGAQTDFVPGRVKP